jgi:adenylate cyclase
MGRLAFRAGDNATALTLAQRALAEVPADGAGRSREAIVVRAEACNTLGVTLARLGRQAEAVEQIERSVAQAEAHNLLQAACRGYTNLGVLYATLDPQRSIDTCLRGLATAKKVGDLGFQSRLYANLAVAYCALTNRCEEEGIEAARAAASLDRRLGLLDHLAVPLIVLGQIYQCHGDPAKAFTSYTEALQLAEQIDEPQLLFPCYDGLATLYLDAGRPAQAEGWFQKAQAVCERAGLEPDALMVLPFLC